MSDAETELKALKLKLQHAAGYKVYRCACVLAENDTAIIECDLHRGQREAAYIAGLEAAKVASQGCVHAIQCVLEIQKLIDAKKAKP